MANQVDLPPALGERLNVSFLALDRDLNELLRIAQPQVSHDDFTALRRSVGDVLGILYIDVMRPLYRQHPGLRPQGMPE